MARFEKLEFNQQATPKETEVTVSQTVREPLEWMQEADRERRSGHYESALRFYSRTLELDRTVVAAWVGQVQMLVQLREFPEADLWGRKSLEIFPNNAELLAGRAQALCRTGELKPAQALSDGSLALAGASAYRWTVRGEILLKKGNKTEEHCFNKAIQVDSDWLVPVEIALACRYHNVPSLARSYPAAPSKRRPSSPIPGT